MCTCRFNRMSSICEETKTLIGPDTNTFFLFLLLWCSGIWKMAMFLKKDWLTVGCFLLCICDWAEPLDVTVYRNISRSSYYTGTFFAKIYGILTHRTQEWPDKLRSCFRKVPTSVRNKEWEKKMYHGGFFWNWHMIMCRLRIQELKIGN